MNNLTSILNYYIRPKCVSSKNDTKVYLSEKITFHKIMYITCPEYHLQTNKQLINLLYNDVNNLTSIMRCCMGSSSQNNTKALSLCETITFHL